jgi:hypothetical protein
MLIFGRFRLTNALSLLEPSMFRDLNHHLNPLALVHFNKRSYGKHQHLILAWKANGQPRILYNTMSCTESLRTSLAADLPIHSKPSSFHKLNLNE